MEEENWTLFAYGMNTYVENPPKSTRLLELICKFSKVEVYRVNVIVFLYAHNK